MISIIIPAYNEEKYLGNCLDSLKHQPWKAYEIIVIVDASTDTTEQIAKSYTKKVYTIKAKNVSTARNFGAQKAKGDILVFLDADCIISKNLLTEINSVMNDSSTKNGYSGAITQTLALEDQWKAKLFWAVGNMGRYFFHAGSGMICCKRELFPGFDERKKIAEDTYLLQCLKKSGKIAYITHAYIKTSSRRMEKEGYLATFYKQCKGFFMKDFNQY